MLRRVASRRFLSALSVAGRLACCLALWGLFLPLSAAADDAVTSIPSLKLVPQDAAFYTAMLRNREQVDIVAQSNAWKKLQAMDFYKEIEAKVKEGLEMRGPIGQIWPILALPENQQAIAVVREMFSDEVFMYGSADTCDVLRLYTDLNYTSTFANLAELGPGSFSEKRMRHLRMILDALNANIDRIKVPDLVIGFRIQTPDSAEEQLRRLEAYVTVAIETLPLGAAWRKQFKRRKVGDGQYMILTIDGAHIPWDEIPFDKAAEKKGQYDKLRDKLKSLQLVVCLGMQKGYLVLSIGKSTDHLAALGQGPSLADHPRLKMLRDHGAQRYTSVSYTSDRLAQTMGVQPEDVDSLVTLAEQALPNSTLPADDQRQIVADLHQAAGDIKSRIPKAGAQLVFSYLTPRGIEGFAAAWGENKYLDATQKLPVLSHLGTAPLLALVGRGRYRPEDYELMVTWLVKAKGYFEKYAVPTMNHRERDQYKQFAEIAYPLLSRLDNVHRKMLLPALADGQMALVFDTSLKSNQWLESLPATSESMAVPMPALVFGVSDVKLLEQALGEYRSIVSDLYKKLRPLVPQYQNLPDEVLPVKVKKLDDGAKVYFYPLVVYGVDKQLALNAGVSPKFFVMSLSPRLTVSLLKSQTLAAASQGPLANADRPLAGAVVFDWPQLVDAAVPWINESVRYGSMGRGRPFDIDGNGGDRGQESQGAQKAIAQITAGAELLKAFRGFSAITFQDGDALITHSEARFQDVP